MGHVIIKWNRNVSNNVFHARDRIFKVLRLLLWPVARTSKFLHVIKSKSALSHKMIPHTSLTLFYIFSVFNFFIFLYDFLNDFRILFMQFNRFFISNYKYVTDYDGSDGGTAHHVYNQTMMANYLPDHSRSHI